VNIVELTRLCYPDMTERGQRFMTALLEEGDLFRLMNNFSLEATNYQYRPAAGTQALGARALTGSYTPADLAQAALQAVAHKIHGFILDYDESHEKDHELGIGIDIDRWYDRELSRRGKAVYRAIEELFFKGDGAGNNFKGVRAFLNGTDNIPGFSTTGVVNAKTLTGASGDSLNLGTKTNWPLFKEVLEEQLIDLAADVIICNRSMGARLTTIAKESKIYHWEKDDFGRKVDFYDGIPILRTLNTSIPLDEPNDNASPVANTTSLYLAKNSESEWGCASNSGLMFRDVGQLEGKESRRVKFEFRGSLNFQDDKAIRRIRNIHLGAIA